MIMGPRHTRHASMACGEGEEEEVDINNKK